MTPIRRHKGIPTDAQVRLLCDLADLFGSQILDLKQRLAQLEKRYKKALHEALEAAAAQTQPAPMARRNSIKKLKAERAAGVIKLSTWKMIKLSK
jgi:hypothetical protein